MVVFAPLSRTELAALRESPLGGPIAAFAATENLCETFSLAPADDEEAERTALLLAGLSGLLSDQVRIVVVAESDALDEEGGFGEVILPGLSWFDVTAIFADDPAAAPAVAAAVKAIPGLGLDAAWDAEPVQRLMSEYDLLWYGPEEVDTLLGS